MAVIYRVNMSDLSVRVERPRTPTGNWAAAP